jgi:hypothetical protein
LKLRKTSKLVWPQRNKSYFHIPNDVHFAVHTRRALMMLVRQRVELARPT